MNKYISILIFILSASFTLQAQVEAKPVKREISQERLDRIEERRDRMKALKIAYITEELDLTPEESQQFWPVYNEYQDKLQALRVEKRKMDRATELSDADAEAQLTKHLELEQRKLEYQRQAIEDLTPIIGAKRVILLNDTENEFKRKVLEKAAKKVKEKKKRKRFK